MEQTQYAGNFVENLFAFLKQFISEISTIFQSGSSLGSGALNWFASNWLKLALGLIVVCIIVDWLVWMIRWRPYWLWFRKKRVVLDDDYEYEPELDQPRYHSRALQPGGYAEYEDDEDEYFEDDEDEYFDQPDEEDTFGALIEKAIQEDEVPDDPFEDMDQEKPPKKSGFFSRILPPLSREDLEEDDPGYEQEDALFEPEEPAYAQDDTESDLFFDDEPETASFFPMVAAVPEEPAPLDDDEDNPWRTGYSTRVPKVDINSPDLSRKMRRRLKDAQDVRDEA